MLGCEDENPSHWSRLVKDYISSHGEEVESRVLDRKRFLPCYFRRA